MASLTCINFVLAALVIAQLWLPSARAVITCQVDTSTFSHERLPLLMDYKLETMYPSHTSPKQLNFEWFQDKLLFCPGSQVQYGNIPLPLRPSQPNQLPPVIRCINGATFEVETHPGVDVLLHGFTCQDKIKHMDWFANTACNNYAQMVNVGFRLDPVGQLNKVLYDFCHWGQLGVTIWAHAHIPGSIKKHPTTSSPDFAKGILHKDFNVKLYYEGCEQVRTFMRLFSNKFFADGEIDLDEETNELTEAEREARKQKLQPLLDYANKYIRPAGSNTTGQTKDYFARGHLVAKAYMYYVPEQKATYYYGNVVPMWQSVNNGNYGLMEDKVRDMADAYGDLEFWAGGIGVLVLEDNRHVYLARTKDGQPRLPVPALLFKLVYSKTRNQAIVFVAINNPYIEQDKIDEQSLCRTREVIGCHQLEPRFTRIDKGYLYCCTYQDFMSQPLVINLGLSANLPPDVGVLV